MKISALDERLERAAHDAPSIPDRIAPGTSHRDVLIARFDARADLSELEGWVRGAQRRTAAFDAMRATAMQSQAAAIAALQRLVTGGAISAIESLALPNALLVQAKPEQQQAVRDALVGVAHITDVALSSEFTTQPSEAPCDLRLAPQTVPNADRDAPPRHWGADAVNARGAWQQGARGAGVTIGFIDSGYDASHPALRAAYRGTQSDGTQSDDYNFGDLVRGTTSANDQRKHGTQVASQAVSPDFGTAPDARAIAVAATDNGDLTTHRAFQALQWMLAPTRTDGSDPDPSLGADIVNNSWGLSDGANQFLRESYDGLRAAGIEMVTAVGNAGPDGRVSAPASYPGHISVGAINKRGEVADFSSRGPSPLPHARSERTPLVVAPGSEIPAAVPGGGYVYAFGTSVAAPAVAGVIAAMLSAEPNATHAQLVQALAGTAIDIGAPGTDDAAGYGLVDAGDAVAMLKLIVRQNERSHP